MKKTHLMKLVIFLKAKERVENSTYKLNPGASSFFLWNDVILAIRDFYDIPSQYKPLRFLPFTNFVMIAKWHFLIPCSLNLSQNHHLTNQGCRYIGCFQIVCISTDRTGDHGILLSLYKNWLTLWQKSVQNNYFPCSKSGALKCHRVCRVLTPSFCIFSIE